MTSAGATPVRSLLRRDRRERALLVESYLVVVLVRLSLTVVPYALLRRLRRPVLRIARILAARSLDDHRVVAAVRTAARHVAGATCLTQAIALHLMLARRRIETHLVVGVTRRDGRFEAHAWVDRDGDVLIGGDVTRFNPLVRIGTIGR